MIDEDREPERYYDWIGWKLRKERKKLQGVNHLGEPESLLDYEAPQLRAKIGELTLEIDLLKRDLKELTECYYNLLKKMSENDNGPR